MADQETEILTTLDESQRTVVLAQDGHHLVLAPPGCGKTHILASRVRWAHSHGVGFEDMLCLTFTNRAARGMINRIGEVMAGEDLGPLHVGNVHHFCSRFLFEQQVVPADSSIVSDEETISILADYTHDDEERVTTSPAATTSRYSSSPTSWIRCAMAIRGVCICILRR